MHPECVADYFKHNSLPESFQAKMCDTCPSCKGSWGGKFQEQIGARYLEKYGHDKDDYNIFLFKLMAGIQKCDSNQMKEGLLQITQCLREQMHILPENNALVMFTKFELAKQMIKQKQYDYCIPLLGDMHRIYKCQQNLTKGDETNWICCTMLRCVSKMGKGNFCEAETELLKTLLWAENAGCIWYVMKNLSQASMHWGMQKVRACIQKTLLNFDVENQKGWSEETRREAAGLDSSCDAIRCNA